MTPKTRDWVYLPRPADVEEIFEAVRAMDCLSVIGVSNLGKSATLRSLSDPEVQTLYLGKDAALYLFIYIDFNQMLVMSEQAFYELVLRSCIDTLREHGTHPDVLRQIEGLYMGLVAPNSSFEVPLRFAQAMSAISDQLPERVVFLFDEVDGPVEGIDGRVFLNLRALKDRHTDSITYITATNKRLSQIRSDADVSEFIELFARRKLHISMLSESEVQVFVERFASEEGVTFSEPDLAFIRLWAGGHPMLLETTCRILGLLTGSEVRDRSQDWIIHRRAIEILHQDINIQGECLKIWNDLSEPEQSALIAVARGNDPEDLECLDLVIAKHLVELVGEDLRIFARVFEDYVHRQQTSRRPTPHGIRVDPDSGEVWVNGKAASTLTNLEYRLLLLLYGRKGKIVSKDEVVEAVWGEDYLEEVDDARIEKLVSRVRQKIEPDGANPKHLMTVRGRGYKLSED